MAMSLAQATIFSRTSLFLSRNALRRFTFCVPSSSSSSDNLRRKKWSQPVASVLELGGVKIAREGNLSASKSS
jgi:phenylalanyl-tRNA synthetase alpha chain